MSRFVQIYFCYIILITSSIPVHAQIVDNIGSGRAIEFDGIDDNINLGNIYDDLVLPVTISVWVNVSSEMTYAFPIFNSQDNLPLYNGITFAVSPVAFSIQYGDGQGENIPAYRRGKSVSTSNISGRWVNLTAIMRNRTDMDLYLNGVDVGGQYSGDSNLPMASLFPGDDAKIGYWFSNGITTHFKGAMDELKIFNRSLSEVEVREQMCKKLAGNEPGLIGYWTFDEISGNTLLDKSPNNFNGILKGNPKRVFSGAPLGDESVFSYTNTWIGKSITLQSDDHKAEADNIRGNPRGIHIYAVNSLPSQINGLDPVLDVEKYFGVFIASEDNDNLFDAILTYKGNQACEGFSRVDNSIATWSATALPKDILQRREFISLPGTSVDLDLGADKTLCGQTSYLLNTGITDQDISFKWNTGQTSSQISVNKTGSYWVEVTSDCGSKSDTVNITIEKIPENVSLPQDERLCVLKPSVLKPVADSDGLEFTWHDGSKLPTYEVSDFGSYWVSVKSACGEKSDTVTFSKVEFESEVIPNVITPNGDPYNERFLVDEKIKGLVTLEVYNRWGSLMFSSPQYNNDWNGENLSSGIYFYRLLGNCIGEKKGSISILK